MRVLAVLVLIATASPAREEATVEQLVALLGHADPTVRTDAIRRLAALGEGIIERIEKLKGLDPEVTRSIRALARRHQTLRILLTGPSGPQRIGAPLLLDVRIVNQTDETFMIPVFAHSPPPKAQVGVARPGLVRMNPNARNASAFLLRIGKGRPRWLHGRHVHLMKPKQNRGGLVLQPTGELHVQLRLDEALRKPGKQTMTVIFNGQGVTKALLQGRNRVTVLERLENLMLESRRIEVQAVGTKIARLDADLRSGKRALVAAAVRELELRDDDAVLDLLRKHIKHRDLRVRAVERIGMKAREEDLDFLRALAADEEERRDVRFAAIEGLGRYKGSRKARSRLFALAQDMRVRDAAVKALARHKSAVTIDLFVRLLQRNFHDGPWSKEARGALLEWTGIHVENRRSEIAAFERWWRGNRAKWISENDK